MMAGSIFDSLWIITQIPPAYKVEEPLYYSIFVTESFIITSNTLTSICSGVGAALLWVAQGKYISECSTEETKGFYFGMFWAFYMASQVFGNLIASLIFESFDLVVFYIIMFCFSMSSAVIFLCL
jgi:Ion channel regulatory protein UNC-93